jgi:hypothetical protein
MLTQLLLVARVWFGHSHLVVVRERLGTGLSLLSGLKRFAPWHRAV